MYKMVHYKHYIIFLSVCTIIILSNVDDVENASTPFASTEDGLSSTTDLPLLQRRKLGGGKFSNLTGFQRRAGENGDQDVTEETPFATGLGGPGHNAECRYYGSDFFKDQKSSKPVEVKKELIHGKICRLNLRLECIPVQTSRNSNSTAQIGPPAGKCKCARSLGDRGIYINGDNKKGTKSGCYIPAGFEHASLCGNFEVPLPYGVIDSGDRVRRGFGKAKDLCVPNAECVTSSSYVGLRCTCMKDFNSWSNGQCELELEPGDGTYLKPSKHILFIIITSGYLFWRKY